MQRREFLKDPVEAMANAFTLPRSVTFVADSCGIPNAFHVRNHATVVVCYEYAILFMQTLIEAVLAGELISPVPGEAAAAETDIMRGNYTAGESLLEKPMSFTISRASD